MRRYIRQSNKGAIGRSLPESKAGETGGAEGAEEDKHNYPFSLFPFPFSQLQMYELPIPH